MMVVAHNLTIPNQYVILERTPALGMGFNVLTDEVVGVPRNSSKVPALLQIGRGPPFVHQTDATKQVATRGRPAGTVIGQFTGDGVAIHPDDQGFAAGFGAQALCGIENAAAQVTPPTGINSMCLL